MIPLFEKYFNKVPSLRDFALKSYSTSLPLDRLVLGVDNIRFDVHLSEGFYSTASKLSLRLISRHASAEHILRSDKITNWAKEKDDFIQIIFEIMTTALNKAKAGMEIQIDYVAQIAITKVLLKILREQFDQFVVLFKEIIRIHELSDRENLNKVIRLKEELNLIQQQKNHILLNAGKELFGYFSDIQKKELNEAREANFGIESILSDGLFTNPMLFVDNPTYDFLMIEEYDILLGHRIEDPDKYESFLFSLKNIFKQIDPNSPDKRIPLFKEKRAAGEFDEAEDDRIEESYNNQLDRWINQLDNIDILLNYLKTQKQFTIRKEQDWNKAELIKVKEYSINQKKVINFFCKKLDKTGFLKRIAAYYEIKPIYHNYCPPLRPQQVMQFLISSKQRKKISEQLNRLKGYYAKPVILKPLKNKIYSINKIKLTKKHEYLIKFLKGFARYHRDYLNYNIVKQAMENVNLITDEKILMLSRANNTLYEFLLPHEEVLIDRPITSHTIIKADVRGSTDITYQMTSRGLNPASYFSLNLFDPITDILPAYGAIKVFIEGDAVILAIYEQKEKPGEWYNVARACGLAINMLYIVQRYNLESSKYNLPILELGIGICFQDGSPAFLFDGDQRIMISQAINLADRLSASSKALSKIKWLKKSPFKLYVFKDSTKDYTSLSIDDPYLRYNVNGIELNSEGFKKLSKEIDLKVLDYKIPNEQCVLYTGKFPAVSGKYQRLIIREAHIQEINTEDLQVKSITSAKYYEVCTNQKLYEYLRDKG